jgi:hypothetical protein
MNLANFNDQQKQALLDLLVMGMYADGNLADVEERKIEGVLATMKFSSESDRRKFIDASVTRARGYLGSPKSTRGRVAEIAKHFPTADLRGKAYSDLKELLASDNKVVDKENQFLGVVKDEFKL